MKYIINYIIITICLSACTSVQQQSSTTGPSYQYRADMLISFDQGNTVYDGTTSAKITTGNLPITFISPVNIDRVQVTTCGRQAVCQTGAPCDSNFVIKKDWVGTVANTFTYNYTPTPDEAAGMCPVYIEAYAKKALTSWGFIGFIGDETMPAQSYCNGKNLTPKGVTVCQSLAGNENTISFTNAVKFEGEKSCNLTTSDNMNFKFIPAAGLCRATFVDQNKNWHRLINIGYSSVLVRVD